MSEIKLEPGRAIQRLQALSQEARTVMSGPPRHVIEIGTEIGASIAAAQRRMPSTCNGGSVNCGRCYRKKRRWRPDPVK
jgi:hypothetical protein